jgi:hypothetical protein
VSVQKRLLEQRHVFIAQFTEERERGKKASMGRTHELYRRKTEGFLGTQVEARIVCDGFC